MNKFLYFAFAILLVFITACSNDTSSGAEEEKEDVANEQENVDNTESDEKQEKSDEDEGQEEKEDNEFDEETGEGYVEGLGYAKVVGVGYNDEVGIDGTDGDLIPLEVGSMDLKINNLQIVEIDLDEENIGIFENNDDEEKVKAIILGIEAENTTEEDVEFHPSGSVLVTDTGEQLESEMLLAGDVDGEYYGEVKKEGELWYIPKDFDEEISNVKLIIDPPYTMDSYEDIGEEQRTEFEIVSYEEALEKDDR